MAAAAPAAEVDIRLELDDDELFLAELFVEEAEREYMERVFLYTYTGRVRNSGKSCQLMGMIWDPTRRTFLTGSGYGWRRMDHTVRGPR